MSEPDVNEGPVNAASTQEKPATRNLSDLTMEELQAEIIVREMNVAAQRFNSLKAELESLKIKIAAQVKS